MISQPQGNAFRFTSFSDTAGTGVVNQVQRGYNGLGQLIVEYQAHGAAVNTSTSPKVQYGYSEMASSANHSRLTSMTYPNGRVVNHNYDSGLDSTISRLSSMSDTSGELESYKYMGLGTVVERGNDQTNVYLTYIGEGTGDAGDQYEGLDRFGRVVDHKWHNPEYGVLDQYLYTHDRNSNRLSRLNTVASDEYTLDFDEFYTYDDLNQILTFDRDTRSQEWDYDGLGNWNSITNDGGSPETRTHNAQNEITGIAGATTPTYDENGNMTGDETGRKFIYDAWNRMVAVKNSSDAVIASYEYDGLKRRIQETAGGATTDLYYSSAWQVLEERNEANDYDTTVQYVWSPVYIDALVLRDRDTDDDGELEERLWVAQDANFNVTALIDEMGAVAERFSYTPFGVATVHEGDYAVKGGSDFVWQHRHQGGRWSAESGLYYFRNRDYSASLGRWMSNDPIEYTTGIANLFECTNNNPIRFLDPYGLERWYYDPRDPRCNKNATGEGQYERFPPPGPHAGLKSGQTSNLKPNTRSSIPGWGCIWPTSRKDRLKKIEGIKTKKTTVGVPQGPSSGDHRHYGPLDPEGKPIGGGGAATCIILIIKCNSGVSVFHFDTGDVPEYTLKPYNWDESCRAIICGGDDSNISNCLADNVIAATRGAGVILDGISEASACGVDPDGSWYEYIRERPKT